MAENIEKKEVEEVTTLQKKVGNILFNTLCMFIIEWIILSLIHIFSEYSYYKSVHNMSVIEFITKGEILYQVLHAIAWAALLLIPTAIILTILEMIGVKEKSKIKIAFILLFVVILIYVLTTFSIPF